MNQQTSPELFSRICNSSFVRVFLYALLCQLTMSISNTVLPLYVMEGLGMSAAQSGMLGTAFTIGSVCCRFFAGYLADRFGRRTMLVLGAGIVGVVLIVLGYQSAFVLLLVFKTVQGVGHAINSTAATAAASEVLPREQMGKGIGYFSLHSTIINAIGPTVALAFMGVGVSAAGEQNYALPMVMGGLGGLIAMGIGASLGYEKKLRRDRDAARPGFRISDFIERRSLMPAVLMLFQAFSSGASVYMIVFANDMGFATVGVYYIINAACTFGIRVALGSRLDGMRPRTVTLIAVAMNITSYLCLGLTLSHWAFLLSAVLMGAYQAMLVPTYNTLALKLAPESRSGAAAATYWLGFDGGMAIGMLAFGVIIDAGGYRGAFLAAGGYMVLFALLAAVVLRRTRPLKEIVSPAD